MKREKKVIRVQWINDYLKNFGRRRKKKKTKKKKNKIRKLKNRKLKLNK